jgi:hypothetical protein
MPHRQPDKGPTRQRVGVRGALAAQVRLYEDLARRMPGVLTVRKIAAALDELEGVAVPTDEQKAEQVGWEMGMDRETAARLANN